MGSMCRVDSGVDGPCDLEALAKLCQSIFGVNAVLRGPTFWSFR